MKKGSGFLKETSKFAQLQEEQIKEIMQLEDKLDVILLAYDAFNFERNVSQENNPHTINPS